MQESEKSVHFSQVEPVEMTQPDARQIWQTALRNLRGQVERSEYDYWLKNLNLIKVENGVALIAAPSSNARFRLETQYKQLIQQTLAGVLGLRVSVQFTIEQPMQPSLMDVESKVPAGTRSRGTSELNNQNNFNGNGSSNNNNHYQVRPNNFGNGDYNTQTTPTPYTEPQFYNGNGNGYSNGTVQEKGPQYNFAQENPELDGDEITGDAYRPSSNGETPSASQESHNHALRYGNLNPKYVFDKFIVGNSNRVTYSAARSVADNPGFHYNPLFIYGGVGLGKTHLLHAIGIEATRQQPHLRALYVSSEKFTNDLVESIRFNRQEDFRNRYRNVDILLIDDIQFIAGKDTTQEEFFHTFNALHQDNRQIVMCSDRPPKAMLVLEDRLRSRFEGGFITDVQMPDYEMRLAILRAKAEFQPSPIPDDVLDYIARKNFTNIRELEGALTRVVGYSLHSRSPLTVDLATQALEDIMHNNQRKMITPERVIETVSQFFNIETKELKGRSRSQDIVLPRQIAMYIIREHTECSLVEVGQAFGGRDHTTVMHGCDKIQREVETNSHIRQQVNTITQILYSESR